jgi:hypothetical protein
VCVCVFVGVCVCVHACMCAHVCALVHMQNPEVIKVVSLLPPRGSAETSFNPVFKSTPAFVYDTDDEACLMFHVLAFSGAGSVGGRQYASAELPLTHSGRFKLPLTGFTGNAGLLEVLIEKPKNLRPHLRPSWKLGPAGNWVPAAPAAPAVPAAPAAPAAPDWLESPNWLGAFMGSDSEVESMFGPSDHDRCITLCSGASMVSEASRRSEVQGSGWRHCHREAHAPASEASSGSEVQDSLWTGPDSIFQIEPSLPHSWCHYLGVCVPQMPTNTAEYC